MSSLPLLAKVGCGVVALPVAYATAKLSWWLACKVNPNLPARLFSILTDNASERCKFENLRQELRGMAVPVVKANEKHSHGISAGERTTASTVLDNIILGAGGVPYSVSMSQRDINTGVSGVRHMHFAKDMAMDFHEDKITTSTIFKFVDTDYYIDMAYYAEYAKPMLIYSYVPTIVAGQVTDGLTTIINNSVVTQVHGGSKYAHQIWDYDNDHLVFHYWWGSIVFLVESVVTDDPNRRIIGLFPVRKIWGWFARAVPGFQLARRHFYHPGPDKNGGLNIIRYCHRKKGMMVSMGIPGEWMSVNMREIVWHSILTRLRSAPKIMLSDVERIVRAEDIADGMNIAAMIFRLYPLINDFKDLPVFMDGGRLADSPEQMSYQTLAPLIFEDGTAMVRTIGPQMCNGNVAPVRSFNNDTSCVENRITKVANKLERFPPELQRYANEFLRFLVPDECVGKGVPVDSEEVLAIQKRPTQRAKFDMARSTMGMFDLIVKSFQKGETYPKYAAPRNISTVNADHTHRYATFMYAITKNVLKPCPWYAFGKTPSQIADAVYDLAQKADWIVPSDYSAWDGTHSKPLCHWERSLGRRYFAKEYHAEWDKLISQQWQATAFTRHGVKYNTGWSRLSGSGDTSPFNTGNNTLVAYMSYRKMGYTPEAAWQKVCDGLAGGDDGAWPDMDLEIFDQVAKSLGHTLKLERVMPGQELGFLGRIWPDPWASPNSVIDIQRQMRRLHLTTTPATVAAEECLLRKAESYLVTDFRTPILSDWARLVIRTHGHSKWFGGKTDDHARHDMSWFSQFDRDDQFPQYPAMHPLVLALAAKQLSTDASHVVQYCKHLDLCTHLRQMRTMEFVLPVPVTVDVITNGGILLADMPIRKPTKPENDDRSSVSSNNSNATIRSTKSSSVCSSVSQSTTGAVGVASAGPARRQDAVPILQQRSGTPLADPAFQQRNRPRRRPSTSGPSGVPLVSPKQRADQQQRDVRPADRRTSGYNGTRAREPRAS